MSRGDTRAAAAVGVAACAACCAGPIVGVLAAVGLTTALGAALFGLAAVLLGSAAVAVLVLRRRRRARACAPVGDEPVAVTLSRGAGRT